MERLLIPFEVAHPNINEKIKVNESPHALVERLSVEKALSQSKKYQAHLIIGSDQVAFINNNDSNKLNPDSSQSISWPSETNDIQIISKPNDKKIAFRQLKAQSGKKVTFLTGVCVFNTKDNKIETKTVTTIVVFRKLKNKEINDYLDHEKPYDCTGSLRSESLGIKLVEAIHSTDPTAIIGLPLIELNKMLRKMI
jgi:predicted house-cleaning NTP pyrophosphatase (Maf/HAM1 superfamily)|tara:strand:- start:123 stop:710 length:588 start_codon:yes stop_codon:yes gene_type:complete